METAEQKLDIFWPKEFGQSITYEEMIKAMKLYSNEKIKCAKKLVKNPNSLHHLIEKI